MTRYTSEASKLELRPADIVSQPLVIDDMIANRLCQLIALPAALLAPRNLTLAVEGGRAHRLDGVGRCTELVRGNMSEMLGRPISSLRYPLCYARENAYAFFLHKRGKPSIHR